MPIDIFAFANGNYVVMEDGRQIPEATGSWLLLIAEKIKATGRDPLGGEIMMPDGRTARLFEVDGEEGGPKRLNWRFK